jgi:RNA polymerase sigma-70 factor (ECF subfamily)
MAADHTMDEDVLLLERIRAGDTTGLNELTERHKQAIHRFVYRTVQNEADAAGITEETFYRVYRNADRFRSRAKVSTWIFTIAVNLCHDHFRRGKKRVLDLSLDAPLAASEPIHLGDMIASDAADPSEDATSKEMLHQIDVAIYQLPDKLKFPFIFCILEGDSYNDCAAVIGKNRKTVETRIYRARKLLRLQLVTFRKTLS